MKARYLPTGLHANVTKATNDPMATWQQLMTTFEEHDRLLSWDARYGAKGYHP